MWNKEQEGKSVKLQVFGLLLDSLKRPSSRKGGDFLWDERQVMLSNTFYLSTQFPSTTHPHSSRMVVTMRKTKVRTWHVA